MIVAADLPYWERQCQGCSTLDEPHTNQECIEQVAENTGVPLSEAMRLFRRPAHVTSDSLICTEWAKLDKETRANG